MESNQNKVVYTLNNKVKTSIVLFFTFLLLSNVASATVYIWTASSSPVTIASGVTTNWSSCSNVSTYKISLLTDGTISGCVSAYHDSGTLEPAIDMFFNTSYLVDTNVQGDWYFGQLSAAGGTDHGVPRGDVTIRFNLIYILPNGTINVLPGSNSTTIVHGTSADYNISLTPISGMVPAGSKLGLRISKIGENSVSQLKNFVGDNASKSGQKSGYFSVTETAVSDNTPPTITLLGSSSVTVEAGSVYTDAGATASDNIDGDITSSIVTVNPVNANIPGTYIVTYNVNDSSNNAATQVTRTVNVVDTTPPTIDLITPIITEATSS